MWQIDQSKCDGCKGGWLCRGWVTRAEIIVDTPIDNIAKVSIASDITLAQVDEFQLAQAAKVCPMQAILTPPEQAAVEQQQQLEARLEARLEAERVQLENQQQQQQQQQQEEEEAQQ